MREGELGGPETSSQACSVKFCLDLQDRVRCVNVEGVIEHGLRREINISPVELSAKCVIVIPRLAKPYESEALGWMVSLERYRK